MSTAGLSLALAVTVLRAARLTGKPEFVEAARRALERMNRFTRPEGAHAYEEPLHTTDIVASAYAVRAFVEGYLLTGEARWLDAAERWAWLGMPFVYVWGAPDRPLMKYATIPYFGGGHSKYPLTGTPVTWNGLEYAKSLLELFNYRTSFPWDRIAEGIIRWTLRTPNPPGSTRYPDWLNMMTGEIMQAGEGTFLKDDRPGRFLAMAQGDAIEPETTVVRSNGLEFRITPEGRLLSAAWKEGELRLDVMAPDSEFDIAIAGVKQQMATGGEGLRPDSLRMRIMLPRNEGRLVSYDYYSRYMLLILHLKAPGYLHHTSVSSHR